MIQSARIHGVLASVFYPPSRKNSNGFRLKAGLETRSLPALARCYPRSFYVDHSHCLVLAPATLAALPSTRAIPDRDVFYVAHPVAPFTFGLKASSVVVIDRRRRQCRVPSPGARLRSRRASAGWIEIFPAVREGRDHSRPSTVLYGMRLILGRQTARSAR